MLQRPAAISAFTNFLASVHQTARGGRMIRSDNPVPESFRHPLIADSSQASTARISGDATCHPNGRQRRLDGMIAFGSCEHLDFDLELRALLASEYAALGRLLAASGAGRE